MTTSSWLPSIGDTAYRVQPLADHTTGRLAWTVQREDKKASYTVKHCPAGNWSCTCQSYWYNQRRQETGCKHIAMLWAMVKALGLPIGTAGRPLGQSVRI
jgi:hypothetical protein